MRECSALSALISRTERGGILSIDRCILSILKSRHFSDVPELASPRCREERREREAGPERSGARLGIKTEQNEKKEKTCENVDGANNGDG